jgi:hypothetical protein
MPKLYILSLLLLSQVADAQTTVSIVADKDNTIYSAFPDNSNGAGQYFFAGKNTSNNSGSIQRALIHFNLTSIPAGAIITSASLNIYLSKSGPTATGIELRKLTADWGEGTSDAAAREAQGAPATSDDATWTKKSVASTPWTTAGGDFSNTTSASVSTIAASFNAPAPTLITVTGQNAITDVQSWVTSPSSNFGWIIISNNETVEGSVKRFISRNTTVTAQVPTLSITYTATTLPITLKGFSASLTKQDALLKWSTATEIDNDYFEIEHSLNGKEFEPIARVKANGSSTTEHSYSYLHQNISGGKNFYRIVDIDKNGNKRYSQIITLSSGITSTLQLYPNPATSSIFVTASSLLQGNEFTINSATGQQVLKGTITQPQIDVKKLLPGSYWLTIRTKNSDLMKVQFMKK